MLFRHASHPAIRAGEVTRTYRAWQGPRAKVGARHRLDARGAVEVLAVDEVVLGDVSARHAREAGFADAAELVAEVKRASRRPLTARSKVFCVRFRYVQEADPRAALREDDSAAAVGELADKVRAMDARSKRGPWASTVLELIARHPGVVSTVLAEEAGRERMAFKADVRRLKALGLTVSLDVGYELSKRGAAVLRRLS